MRVEEPRIDVGGGTVLLARSWLPDEGVPVRGRLVLVHGLGDHAGRYDEFGRWLAEQGVAVLAHDQRGHGRSPGRPGVIDGFGTWLDDLHRTVEFADDTLPGTGPMVVLGHSMGGLIALRYLQEARFGERLTAGILSAPWLSTAPGVPLWKRAMAPVLERVAPRLTVPAGIEYADLTRDPDKVREMEEDPLLHDRVSAGLNRAALDAQAAAFDGSAPPIPVLMLVPLADRIVDPRATLAWAERLGPESAVERLEGGMHEPLNDIDRTRVFERVRAWIERWTGGEPTREGRVS